MSLRISSGVPALDAIFEGGLPANSINLVAGPPGSGKTILAHHFVFTNASVDRPAVYVSTVSEPMEKMLRYGQELTFFDTKVVGSAVFYEDGGQALTDGGLTRFIELLDQVVKQRRPSVIVIDSFKALHAFADGIGDFRRFLHLIAGMLGAFPATTLWVGEYTPEEMGSLPEFAVADAIVHLSTLHAAGRNTRVMETVKLRGSGFLSGQHAYRLSSNGVEVFPRLAVEHAGVYQPDEQRISSGIPGLDAMMGGGLWPGTTTLVAGPSGTGKTVSGLHFVFHGARRGEPGLIASLEDDRAKLERTARGFGWTLDEHGVEVFFSSAIDLYVDEWVHELIRRMDATGTRRVVVDGMAELAFATPDAARFREFMYSLVQHCAWRGANLILTLQVPDLYTITRLSENSISLLADNIVLLHYLRGESQVKRALVVLKTRSSAHETEIRELTFGPSGVRIGDTFGGEQDLR